MRAGALLLLACASALTAPGAASGSSFHVRCSSSHVSHDDPIVFPGMVGAAHRHEFFGARSADAHATTASLRASDTSCDHSGDTAAYWVPTLEVRGVLVRGTMRAYYRRAGKQRAEAPPPGLRVLAGDPRAASPQPRSVTSWQCIGRGNPRRSSQVPACRVGERLGAWVHFPDCWDGRRLDSPDHRSHLASARSGACPRTHPVAIMRVSTLVTWPVRPRRPGMVRLAGGVLPATGMHGDFWNAWHQPSLRQLRWDCIELARGCGAVTD